MQSKRFVQVYDALPPEAQQLLVHTHLAPLLDLAPRHRRKKTLAVASDLHRRHARMPALDIKAKKAEIAVLLLELARDAKRAVIKERSRREQLLSEAVDTIVAWLNDIWKVVFEFRSNFGVAHACLLYACDALDQIGNGCGGCRCAYASMFIPIKITRSTGKVVKSFSLHGAHNLESVALWIWRDLFMTILATGTKRQRDSLPDMIDDIRILLGWRALEHLLRGGSTSFGDDDDDDLDDLGSRPDISEDDGNPDYVSDDGSSVCDEHMFPRHFYPSHWSWRIADQQSHLRDIVHTALLDIFKVAPSGPLYSSMIAIAEDEDDLEEELHPLIISVAPHSSDNFSAALRILSLNNRTESVHDLLTSYIHLLRPQDAPSLQFAVLVMSSNYVYRAYAIAIIEEELSDITRAFHAAVRVSFANIDSDVHKSELDQILALRRDAHRRTRIERWVKGVLTPHVDTTFPAALAALMMGLPLPPAGPGMDSTDDGDMLGYFELEAGGEDPAVEDLREEFRPNIKARLQGWVDTAVAIKGGPAVLQRVYGKVVMDMPFLRANDIVDEMSARIGDRPSKVHVSEALEAFKDFCEKQYLKLSVARGRAARRVAPLTGPSRSAASASARASASASTTASLGESSASGAGTASAGPSSSSSVVEPSESAPIEDVD